MDDRQDYYRILHVAADAPEEIIKSSYRTLMQRMRQHPDLGGDHEKAALINEAYATLTDPVKRAEYDHRRGSGRHATRPEAQSRRTPMRSADFGETTRIRIGHCLFCETPHEHGVEVPKHALCSSCGSPLCQAEPHNVGEAGVRALNRLQKHQTIAFFTDWPQDRPHSGQSRDISLDGMQFVATEPLSVNQMIKIDCPTCRCVARVAHVQQSGAEWIVGVQFMTLRFEQTQGSFVSARA